MWWRSGEDDACPIKGLIPSFEEVSGFMGGGHCSDWSFSNKCGLTVGYGY